MIRRAQLDDAPEIARLSNELGYPGDTQTLTERLHSLLTQQQHCILVACNTETPDGLLGWAAAERRLLLESGERVELIGLVVDSRMHRQGIGRLLIEAVEAWAREQQVTTVFLRSNINRTESHPFYASLGYTRSKTQHAYVRQLPA